MKTHPNPLTFWLTLLADLFFVWVLFYFGMGGWPMALALMTGVGPLPWLLLPLILFLMLYHSDYRTDLPLFVAGLALGYWGEWWGTTRGIWTYWNGATPPVYLPPLWGLGLLTVYRLSRLVSPWVPSELPAWVRKCMAASLLALPLLTVLTSFNRLSAVDWRGRLDIHFYLGILVTALLLLPKMDVRKTFLLYFCGMLLGGLYEYLGTSSGEWAYITHEIPPLWIVPLWGLAAAAMTRLAGGLRLGLSFLTVS